MSLIRTDYVSEWRISAHAQSVLAAGQEHHSKQTKYYPKTSKFSAIAVSYLFLYREMALLSQFQDINKNL